jgi:hypothetical protein
MDEVLRARLRIPHGADRRLRALRAAMRGIDVLSRGLTGQPFFAIREAEALLEVLGDRTDRELIDTLLSLNGGTRITAHGLENIPRRGAVIIGSTHPIGTFDFITHAGALLEVRPDLKVVANREAERYLGASRIVAVDFDRRDKVLTARQTYSGMQGHLGDGGALVVFGSGTVPDMANGLLVEPPWRPGITRMSAASGAPIVPASTNMRNSAHYYRTRKVARILSGGNESFGRTVASLRYASELMAKFGGSYDVHYGPVQPPGTAPEVLKDLAEGLIPGLYTPHL